jgi:hypothetical protein
MPSSVRLMEHAMLLIYLVSAKVPEPIVLSHVHDHAEWIAIEITKQLSVQLAIIDCDQVEKNSIHQ